MGAIPLISVVDDDESVRESLPDLLRELGFAACAFPSGEEFLASGYDDQAQCLILDIAMPGMSGPDLHRELQRRQKKIPIIFITGHGDVPTSVQAMKAGAVKFLTKPMQDDLLLGAIGKAIERSRVAICQEVEMRALEDRYASLTPREREVMALVVAGRLNKQIGGELEISEITVKAHRGRVMRKMKADSLAELVKISARLRPTPAPKV